ncbi:hypothetical protein ABKV19_016207 [Rosa sericea]
MSSRDGRLNMEGSLVQETVEPDEEVDDSNSNINATTEGVSPSSLPEGENFKELDSVVLQLIEKATEKAILHGAMAGCFL